MNRISTSLGMAVMALAALALSAEDYQPLIRVTQATWPEKHHIGVICNFQADKAQVLALARAAGGAAHITVADTRTANYASAAATLLANVKTDFVVLLPQDQLFGDGSFSATQTLRRLASRGVPTIGTTPLAVKQGAVFSVGEGTGGQLLVTDRLIGTVDVIMPDRALISQKASFVLQKEGMATIAVHSAR